MSGCAAASGSGSSRATRTERVHARVVPETLDPEDVRDRDKMPAVPVADHETRPIERGVHRPSSTNTVKAARSVRTAMSRTREGASGLARENDDSFMGDSYAEERTSVSANSGAIDQANAGA